MTQIELENKRILITGGLGFVGSNLTERAIRAGARVTVLDDMTVGRPENVDEGLSYRLVPGSVTDAALVTKLVREADYVAHLAARNIIVSTANPLSDYDVNIGGTLNVLMAARECSTRQVVYTSSASVYGNPQHLPISEYERTKTFSPYSVSKLAGENYCRAFYETYGVRVTSVRYSNVYGPKQDPANPYCGVVSKFMESYAAGQRPQIHGDGQQTRDFTFVDDAVDATILAMLSPKAEGTMFNLGTGIETSINDLARLIGKLMNSDLEPVHVDRRDIDNIRRRVLNIEKIRTRLRWLPQVGLEEGLRRTLRWFESAKERSTPAEVTPVGR
jgi:UDP-glucose 4-epimerase